MMERLEKIYDRAFFEIDHLKRCGMIYNRKRSGEIVEHFKKHKPAYMWMCQHFCVYERSVG